MPTVDFIPFAIDPGANVASQAQWIASSEAAGGFQAGIAQSPMLNKAWRQPAYVAAALATVMSARTGADVLDDGNFAGFVSLLQRTFSGPSQISPVAGASHTYSLADVGKLVVRSNGAPMIDKLPGAGELGGALPAQTIITIGTPGAGFLLAINAGVGSAIQGTNEKYIWIGYNQQVSFLSDGVNYWPINLPDKAVLGLATTFFVSPTGSNDNHGLTAAAPFLTKEFAYDWMRKHIDARGEFSVTVQCAAGADTNPLLLAGRIQGIDIASRLIFLGDVVTPSNCTMNVAGDAVTLQGGAVARFRGFRVSSSTGSFAFRVTDDDCQLEVGKIELGGANHLSGTAGRIRALAEGYTILSGARQTHISSTGAAIELDNTTVTLLGTPSFATAFILATRNRSLVQAANVTFVGPATGTRYLLSLNAVLDTGGQPATYIPGDVTVAPSSGAQFG
jgi:hypothetical protein